MVRPKLLDFYCSETTKQEKVRELEKMSESLLRLFYTFRIFKQHTTIQKIHYQNINKLKTEQLKEQEDQNKKTKDYENK